jgi:hypothetical protein
MPATQSKRGFARLFDELEQPAQSRQPPEGNNGAKGFARLFSELEQDPRAAIREKIRTGQPLSRSDMQKVGAGRTSAAQRQIVGDVVKRRRTAAELGSVGANLPKRISTPEAAAPQGRNCQRSTSWTLSHTSPDRRCLA